MASWHVIISYLPERDITLDPTNCRYGNTNIDPLCATIIRLIHRRMLTKYITAVTTIFSPFNPRSGKTARNFLALLPPNARRDGMTISVKMLGQAGANTPATLALKFSTCKTSG